MNTNFDKVLFLISTDCFESLILKGFSQKDINIVKQAARNEIGDILGGGNNYFLEADYSESRIIKTKINFFDSVRKQGGLSSILQKIEYFEEVLNGITTELDIATHVIYSVAARLHWFHIDDLIISIPDDLMDILEKMESIDLELGDSVFEWNEIKRIWFDSTSEWDCYLRQDEMFDGTPDVLCTYLFEVLNFTSRLNFLYTWKDALVDTQYSKVVTYISDEAHAELNNTNPDAAELIDKILGTGR